MADICGDNRFEIIKKAKAELLKSTNIETSEDEIKVLDNFLLRCWQMGWLERYEKPSYPLNIPIMTTEFVKEHGLPCPNGYIFKDDNGNVINATKIVLEKKEKEYPKTYKEAFDMLGYRCDHIMITNPPKDASQITKQEQRFMLLMIQFQKLLTCRDAYWKIAGEEMGLGEPWEPDWNDGEWKWCMSYSGNYIEFDQYKSTHHILAFPTEEMRDAFYENFKEEIQKCKELL